MTPPLIYNLFPRLVGPTTRWMEHARRAREMEFNWIYLNPWHYPGFSGSLYAPKEFGRLNPLFLPPGADPHSLEPLRDFLHRSSELGLPVMMDLVVNHTSKDCPLADEHPDWYRRSGDGELVSPSAVDPDDPTKVTVWGDLAEIDNEHSPDRENLWRFWANLVETALELGFAGFRCDAAYMVPAELWSFLIRTAESRRPGTLFFAETLGAPEQQVLALREAGFDYFFNSSKWWDFREPWALEQHESFGRIAPSISFPETHDTERLAEESGGDEAVQRQRYAFAAAFSAGLMMPLGYEYGFRRKPDVVRTMPSDWERRNFDLRDFVTRVNQIKLHHPALHGEGTLRTPAGLGHPVLLLERHAAGVAEPAYVLVNTDRTEDRHLDLVPAGVDPEGLVLLRVCRDEGVLERRVPDRVELRRAEVVYLLSGSGGVRSGREVAAE